MMTSIGPHRVRHGSLMDTDGVAALMGGEYADAIYTDPPWGNLKMWETLKQKQTGTPANPTPTLDHFLHQLFRLSALFLRADGPMIVAYGVKWRDQLVAHAAANGFDHIATALAQYKGGGTFRPVHIHVFAQDPGWVRARFDAAWVARLAGTSGYRSVQIAAAPITCENGLLADFCCGMGYSAQVAVDNGMRFRGNELNGARLAKTTARLQCSV